MRLTRRSLIAMSAAYAASGPARADAVSDLYRARTIVTGRRPETRIPGMVRCLSQLLGRVSGNPRLAEKPAVAELARNPEAAVTGYTYRDLYAFRPIRDEQGTRDRPYEMTVQYDPAKVDAMLAGLGAKPWLAQRPPLVVFLAVHHIGSTFMLTASADQGELMRESFQDAAWNSALDVVIPSDAVIQKAGITVDGLPGMALPALAPFVDQGLGQVPLAGTLSWSKELLAWKARWRIAHGGKDHAWGINGVNFDAAFRNGVGGAAQVLSGNGDPA